LKVEKLKVESCVEAETVGSRLSAVGSCGSSIIDVLSKCDLSSNLQLSTFQPSTFNLSSPIPTSAKTGEGLDALRGAIAAELERKAAEPSDADSALVRDAAALIEAQALLVPSERASTFNFQLSTFNSQSDLVLLANRVRAASGRLGEAIGATYSADMFDALFSRFCVGK